MITDLDVLREEVLRYRAKHDLNQEEFAQLCGLTRVTICTLESGRYRGGKQSELSKLSKAKINNVLEMDE